MEQNIFGFASIFNCLLRLDVGFSNPRGSNSGFETYSLGFVYNTAQHPLCLTDMDGDLRDELVRVGTDGLYIDYFEDADARYTRRIEIPSLNLPKWSICAGDLDGNGFIDFLLGGDKKHLHLFNMAGLTINKLPMGNWSANVPPCTILITMETWMPLSAMTRCVFALQNRGDGMLEDGKKIQGFSELAGNYSAIWTDYNNDRRIDVYISKCLAETNVNDPVALTNFIKHGRRILYRGGQYSRPGRFCANMDNGL